jgi:pyrimidine deaminase RibD-like protein
MMDNDHKYMQLAIEVSKSCKSEPGKVSPMVGAVVIKDGEVVTTAYRGEQEPGEHAEFTALEKKIDNDSTLAGSTVYTTLEPCTTRGHTKHGDRKIPCADRLVERKVSRVVIGMLDPNPAIQGKGYQLLRDHNIAIAMFQPELAAEVEDMNRHFRRAIAQTVKEGQIDSDFVNRFKSRALDEWYSAIKFMYANRNLERSHQAVFAHLVEVIGGLSLLASGKRKADMVPEDFLPKAIAWWLALCAKVGVTNVTELLWVKYPGVCPYCRQQECDSSVCRNLKKDNPHPDWDKLRKVGKTRQPKVSASGNGCSDRFISPVIGLILNRRSLDCVRKSVSLLKLLEYFRLRQVISSAKRQTYSPG